MKITKKKSPTYVVEIDAREAKLIEDCINIVDNNFNNYGADEFESVDVTKDEVQDLWENFYRGVDNA